MNNTRQRLAYLCGLLMAGGYMGGVAVMGHWTASKVVVGLMFGGSVVWSLLDNPDRATKKASLVVTALALVGLNVFIGFSESTPSLIFAIVWTGLYAGALFSFAQLHQKERENGTYPPQDGSVQ